MIWFLSSLLFTTTPAAATAGDAEAGWKVAERNVYIDFDLETYPLEVSTDSHLGSNEQLIVTFYTAQGDYAGNVQVYFTSTHQYYLNYCSSSYTNFPTTLPTATDKVWRITVTRTSGTRVVVHCNEKEVLNILMSSSTCYSGWSTYWSRDIAQIYFNNYKPADYYRAGLTTCVQGSDGSAASSTCDDKTVFSCFSPMFSPTDVQYGCGGCPEGKGSTCVECRTVGCNAAEADFQCYNYDVRKVSEEITITKREGLTTCKRIKNAPIKCNRPKAAASETSYTSVSGCGPCKADEKNAQDCYDCSTDSCNTMPTCSKPTIQDGKLNPDTSTINFGEVYTVTCDDGFVVMGPWEITCQADGQLSEEPSCEPEMICDGDQMTLNLEKGNFETIYLLEKGEGCEFSGDTQTIQIAVHECGTKVEINSTHVIYSNQVIAVSSYLDSETTRSNYMVVSFHCAYNRTGNTKYASWEVTGQTVVEKWGEGSLTFLLELYKSDEFSEKVKKEDYPYPLSLQDILFMQVLVDTSDPDLSVGVIHLQAKDTPNEIGGRSYDIIKDGCSKDSTLQLITTDKETKQALNPIKKRFSLKPFHFVHNQTIVYVHALVKVCGKNDDSCSNICEEEDSEAESRRRRSVGEKSDQHYDQYHVYQGPLVVTNVVSGVEIGLKVECSFLTLAVYISCFL